MAWGNPPPIAIKPAGPSKIVTPEQLAASGTEDGHQMALFCWIASSLDSYPALRWCHAIPNGGSRHKAEAAKLVAAGSRSGVWDIFLPVPTRYAGLYVEMKEESRRKSKNGGLSTNQMAFGEFVRRNGYHTEVCYNWIEAKDAILNYLNNR